MKILLILLFITNLMHAKKLIISVSENQTPLSIYKKFSPYQKSGFQNLYVVKDTKKNRDMIKKANHSFEEDIEVEFSSITPGELITNDPLSGHQWLLKSKDHILSKDIDDINSIQVHADERSDINYSNIKLKRKPVIAIIDSGIDYDHPELKDNMAFNLDECPDKKMPFRPKEDLDNNGYKGDCLGWDFTTDTHKPLDDIGHGTHIAGIIAAKSKNSKGISGIEDEIKVLPLKVMNSKGSLKGFATNVAKAILYAIDRKVDVINLSLGWPRVLDKKFLRQSIEEAYRNGIMIVAAAGNNDHNSPIFPCAYEQVICVGSIDIDYKVSNFSNFGAHVDVLAPGDQILSTFPTSLTPNRFSIKGYEIKDGTSQAAPIISSLAAILKSENHDQLEIEKRIKLASTKLKSNKNTAYGLVNFNRAIQNSPKGIIARFKSNKVSPILNKEAELIFSLVNANNTDVSKKITINNDTQNIKLTKNSIKYISFKIENLLNELPSKQKHLIEVGDEEFFIEKDYVLRDTEFESKTYALPKNIEKLASVNNLDGINQNLIYYEENVQKSGIVLRIFEKQFEFNEKVIFIKNATRLVSITNTNIWNMGSYLWVRAVIKENEESQAKLIHMFYDNAYNLIDKKELLFEGTVLSPEQATKINNTPYQISNGLLPSYQQSNDPFEKDENIKRRLFKFIIDKDKIRPIAINTEEWKNNLKINLNHGLRDTINLLNLTDKGLLISIGSDFIRKNYLINLDINTTTKVKAQIALDGMSFSNNFFIAQESKNLWTVLTPDLSEYIIENDNKEESLLFHLGSFQAKESDIHFVQSTNRLQIFLKKDEGIKNIEYPIAVSSFIDGNVFKQSYVAKKINGKPGLYVDDTQFTSQHLYTIQYHEGEIQSRIADHVFVEKGCVSMNPVKISEDSYFTIRCKLNDTHEIKFLKMNR